MMYYVYLMLCEDDTVYTGITTDIERRLEEHKSGTGSKYVRAKHAVKILHAEKFKNRSSATKREMEIKSWPRARKLELIKRSTYTGKTHERHQSRKTQQDR